MKYLVILLSILFLSACGSKSTEPERQLVRPQEVPLTTCSGDTIDWDWSEQNAWDEGRLKLIKDSTGCVSFIAIKHPDGTISNLEKQGAFK